MQKGFPKQVLFCTLALLAAVLCLGQENGKEGRELIANGENAEAGRFESFASIQIGGFGLVSGVLITPNVVLFSTPVADIVLGNLSSVTIGRLGDTDERSISAMKVVQLNPELRFNATIVLGVLNSDSTKTPATIDAGSCEVGNGCLDVSVVGRGETSFSVEGSSDTPLGLNQPLQQADFELLEPSSCINQFDGENTYYNFLYKYLGLLYDCEDLECHPNKTEAIKGIKSTNELYSSLTQAYVDDYETLFDAGEAVCLKNISVGICNGDLGAPLFSEDDVLVALVLRDYCYFEGVYEIFPVSATFTAGIIETLETELASLQGAKTTLTKAADGTCSCTKSSESSSITFSPPGLLMLLASTVLIVLSLI